MKTILLGLLLAAAFSARAEIVVRDDAGAHRQAQGTGFSRFPLATQSHRGRGGQARTVRRTGRHAGRRARGGGSLSRPPARLARQIFRATEGAHLLPQPLVPSACARTSKPRAGGAASREAPRCGHAVFASLTAGYPMPSRHS